MMRPIPALAAVLLAALLSGCASTPQATRDRDAEAKQFVPHPGTAAVYVFRDDFPPGHGDTTDTVLYVDHRLIGATLPETYFRVELRPGTHVIHGYAADPGSLRIDVHSGETYFVALNVIGGRSHFRLVDAETARRAIRACCALLENWAPGQRPLLR